MKKIPIVVFFTSFSFLAFLVLKRLWLIYGSPMGIEGNERLHNANVQTAMQIIVSLSAGAASLFVVLARRYGPKDKHWAYATAGMILGFWLNSK
jgi:hypothetical protein